MTDILTIEKSAIAFSIFLTCFAFNDQLNAQRVTGKVQAFERSSTVASVEPGAEPKSEAAPNPVALSETAGQRHGTDSGNASLDLETLVEIEQKIKRVIPAVMPCVVSIEGGTGVVVSADGYILTASHVTRQAGRSVNVQFADGTVYTATTLGTNYNTDTAALRLDSPGPWPFVKLTDSTLVQPGDWCISLGYPLSFPRGKPAAVRIGRVLKVTQTRLVTDCPIMGGDSGGPLLNLNGHLVGINSRVNSRITDNIHVPVQIFQDDWKQLAASVDIRKRNSPTGQRAYLGILGETDDQRVRIRRVHRGSPAETAGLLADDVILELDGQPIESFNDVLEILDARQPGEKVIAELNRFGKLVSIPIELGSKY